MFESTSNASMLNEGQFATFAKNWLPWQRLLRNHKKTPGFIILKYYPPFGKKIENQCSRSWYTLAQIKKKKLMQVKISILASLPSGQKKCYRLVIWPCWQPFGGRISFSWHHRQPTNQWIKIAQMVDEIWYLVHRITWADRQMHRQWNV